MALKQTQKPQAAKQQFVAQPDMEPGTYPARLVQIIDCGLQNQRSFIPGETKKPANEVMLTYEFVDVFMVDEKGNEIEDKPRWFSETLPWYGPHVERATSTKRYNAFDPKNEYDGDLSQCIEVAVNVTIAVVKKGEKTYVNITNVAPMRQRDAEKTAALVNPTKVFDLDDPDMDVFNALPQWIQEKLKGNLNYAGSPLEKQLDAGAEQKNEAPPEAKAEMANKDADKAQQADDEDANEDAPW